MRSGVAKKLRKLRDQTSSKKAMVTPCMTRVRKSHSSTAPSSAGTKLKPAARDRVEVAGDEAPQHDVDRDPGEHRQDALRAAAIEVEAGAARWRRRASGSSTPSRRSASCATATNRSSRLAAPCSRGRVFGSPSSRILPRDRNSTRSQTASTSYMLWLVHSTPQWPLSTKSAMPARMSRAVDGSIEAVGSSSSSSRGPVQHRLGEAEPGLLAGGQHARLGACGTRQIVGLEQRLDPLVEAFDAVDHAEHPQVLLDRQVAGQRRVDGGEIGALPAPGCGPREVDALDLDPPRRRREHAEDHVDGGGLARRRSGPSSPTISPGATWNETPSTAFSVPKDFASRSTARTGGGGEGIGRRIKPGRSVKEGNWLTWSCVTGVQTAPGGRTRQLPRPGRTGSSESSAVAAAVSARKSAVPSAVASLA